MSSNDQNPIDDPQYIATATYNDEPKKEEAIRDGVTDVIDF